jgi:hypothetical protein
MEVPHKLVREEMVDGLNAEPADDLGIFRRGEVRKAASRARLLLQPEAPRSDERSAKAEGPNGDE